MDYISTPVGYVERTYRSTELRRDVTEVVKPLTLRRELHDMVTIIDNMVEMIVFTPRGGFAADPDFGFEYWSHEYSNMSYRDFNNGQQCSLNNEITRQRCQQSITNSLLKYAPMLLNPNTSILFNVLEKGTRNHNINSKYQVSVVVVGHIKDGIDSLDYRKVITFMVEPTVKRRY